MILGELKRIDIINFMLFLNVSIRTHDMTQSDVD